MNLYNLTLKEDFSLHFNNLNHFEPSLVDIGQVVRKKEVKNYLKSLRTGGWTERRRTKKKEINKNDNSYKGFTNIYCNFQTKLSLLY